MIRELLNLGIYKPKLLSGDYAHYEWLRDNQAHGGTVFFGDKVNFISHLLSKMFLSIPLNPPSLEWGVPKGQGMFHSYPLILSHHLLEFSQIFLILNLTN